MCLWTGILQDTQKYIWNHERDWLWTLWDKQRSCPLTWMCSTVWVYRTFGQVGFCRTFQLGYVYKIDVNKNSAVYISRWPIINSTDVQSEQEIIDISTSVFESSGVSGSVVIRLKRKFISGHAHTKFKLRCRYLEIMDVNIQILFHYTPALYARLIFQPLDGNNELRFSRCTSACLGTVYLSSSSEEKFLWVKLTCNLLYCWTPFQEHSIWQSSLKQQCAPCECCCLGWCAPDIPSLLWSLAGCLR